VNIQKTRNKVQFEELTNDTTDLTIERKLRDKLVKMQKSGSAKPATEVDLKPEMSPRRVGPLQLVKSVDEATENKAQLSSKIRDAMTLETDPEKSLADIRAILVGPMRQLHDARVEEMVSILEENDRATRMSFSVVESRLTKLNAETEKLSGATEETFRKLQEQSVYFEFALQKSEDKQRAELDRQQERHDAYAVSVSARFDQMTGEIAQLVDELAKKSSTDLSRLESDMAARLQYLATAQAEAELLSRKLEAKLAEIETQSEKLNRRNAEVFSQGFSDLAERFLNIRAAHTN
jgi:hypothetical protein